MQLWALWAGIKACVELLPVPLVCVFKSSIIMGSRMFAAGMGSSIESYIIGRMYIDAFNTNYCTSGITWSGLNLHGVRLRWRCECSDGYSTMKSRMLRDVLRYVCKWKASDARLSWSCVHERDEGATTNLTSACWNERWWGEQLWRVETTRGDNDGTAIDRG